MKTIKLLFLALLVLGPISASHGQTPTSEPITQLLEEGRSTLQVEKLEQLRAMLEPCANTVNADFECRYRLAQTGYYLSFAYELQKQRGPGEKALEKALQCALKASRQKNDSSDIHSLLADIYARKIGTYGDMFTGMDCGPKVADENKKALALSPDNPRVQASLGRQYLMAPPLFGGDVNKAVTCFNKSLELNPQSDETLYWLAKAYGKLKDKTNREITLKKALVLNPQNILVQKELGPLP